MKEDIEHFYHNNYDQNQVLSKCDDILFEAKRVLLNEDIKQMANFSLSVVNKNQNKDLGTTKTESSTRQCKKDLDWSNDSFWEHLPHPRNINYDTDIISAPSKLLGEESQIVNMVIQELLNQDSDFPNSNDLKLCLKYFHLWIYNIKSKKCGKKISSGDMNENEKLDNFLKKFKVCKKKKKPKHLEDAELNKQKDILIKNKELSTNTPKSSKLFGSYEHRFTAQKYVIDKQKEKLKEQDKIIEELKFGIIRDDLLKSIKNTKVNIKEIFTSCSERVKCKVPIILVEETKFIIDTHEAPKIIQKLEQRAVERAQNRQLIQERKRILEKHRQILLENAIEKKKVMEEDNRKKNLEKMKERRKKELEMDKLRQANKQRYLDNLNIAIRFHNRFILRECFKYLYSNMKLSKEKYSLACHHFDNKSLRLSIHSWLDYMDQLYKVQNDLADAHLEYKVLKKCLGTWKADHLENLRNMQVAEDLYDLRLTNNTFVRWHRNICLQVMSQYKYKKVADEHYERKILFHYFYQWRSLKAVIELEKAKELKKQRWREKVWEILPDYKPQKNY